jgi:ribonucleoside-diphosphate reductase beta chain
MTTQTLLTPGFEITLEPMRYPQFWASFEQAQSNNWTVQEISFSTDIADLREKLSGPEKHVVSRLIAFFAVGDQLVQNNAAITLYKHVNAPEARAYYSRQIYEEALHTQFYRLNLKAYVPDIAEQQHLFAANETVPSVKAKAQFCEKWMDQMNAIDTLDTDDKKRTFLMNLLAFACAVEGLFFFAAFAYVYYLRDRGLLHGLASGTNWVFRDESTHMRFAFQVVDVIRREEPNLWEGMEDRVREMLAEAIECEMQFARDTLSMGVVGFSETDMHEYLRYVADGHCQRLGMAPIYNAKCPFDFMLKQDVQSLTSFFERTVADYSVGIGGDVSFEEDNF